MNATNVTVSFWLTSASGEGTALANLTWGPNASYDYVGVTGHLIGESAYKVFIDFLAPNSTFDYKVAAWTSCSDSSGVHMYQGSTTGSSSTHADNVYVLTGLVRDAQGSTPPYYPMPVWVSCTKGGQITNWTSGTTASGAYSVSMYPDSGSGCQVLTVTVYNSYCLTTPSGQAGFDSEPFQWYWNYGPGSPCAEHPGPLWTGHFNETIAPLAAQWMHFLLPLDYVTGYMPSIIDYSNAPSSGYTDLSVASGTTYGESYTYSWSVGASVYGLGGGASGSKSYSTSYGTTQVLGNNQGTLCYAVKYDVTGTLQFSASTRTWGYGQTLFNPQDGNFCNQIAGFQIPTDWIENGTGSGAYAMPGPANSSWANGLVDFPLWEGNYYGYGITISSSYGTTTGADFGFQVSGTLAGVLPLSFQASEGWSQTVSGSGSTTLTFDIQGPGSGVSCYNVFGDGGSATQKTADMVAVYYWPGSVVGGVPYCG